MESLPYPIPTVCYEQARRDRLEDSIYEYLEEKDGVELLIRDIRLSVETNRQHHQAEADKAAGLLDRIK